MAFSITRLSSLGVFFYGYIKNKMYLDYNSQSVSGNFLQQQWECRNVPAVLIQNAFDGVVNRRSLRGIRKRSAVSRIISSIQDYMSKRDQDLNKAYWFGRENVTDKYKILQSCLN